jgi:DEAD/DEAH box helicase domain-containing protein
MEKNPRFSRCVSSWKTIPPSDGDYREIPPVLHPKIREGLASQGITRLYSHQAEAIEAVTSGRNVAVITPTASGKTLCYNLPVVNSVLEDPSSRALYLFPTKALSQDQAAALLFLNENLGAAIKSHTYDGDTPGSARRSIREAGHIVITNPDMLHSGILPHHTKWMRLFENLRYIVVDEVHNYRGVFGSHVANVFRRLKRVCRFYGSNPVWIACSATIANPLELAERLTGETFQLVGTSGAPTSERHVILYNPPVVNRELGIRRSSLLEARDLALRFLSEDVRTIVFARSRLAVEVLLSYLKEATRNTIGESNRVRGYRGGYLPGERRAIEKGLREGSIHGVVSTNALELGVDIGELEASIMVGYPGTVASLWQQAGRAGRRVGVSAAVLVASSSPLDQYLVDNPDYLLDRSPEHGLINPDNLYILTAHLKCAAFEIPFEAREEFGPGTREILDCLAEKEVLYPSQDRYYWAKESYPAEDISLRTVSSENFVIVDTTQTGKPRVVGEVDLFSAPLLIHEGAIYIHEGRQHHVDRLDFQERKAYVRQVDVDYYTDANLAVDLRVLQVNASSGGEPAIPSWGEVLVSALATMYKKIKFGTHENVGSGPISLPETQMHTEAYWFSLSPSLVQGWSADETQRALMGMANLVGHVAPLFLMCDPRDIGVVPQVKSPFTGRPTVYVYDRHPAGVGLSEKMYQIHTSLLHAAREMLASCQCPTGCPSCVGPSLEQGRNTKALTRAVLDRALEVTGSQTQGTP